MELFIKRFDRLTVDELFRIYKLRTAVYRSISVLEAGAE